MICTYGDPDLMLQDSWWLWRLCELVFLPPTWASAVDKVASEGRGADVTVVHGEWCGTKTWPTSCPSCSSKVFFFSCGHGSKVFFDELGSPWPVHDCGKTWARGLRRFTDDNGDVVVELKPGITVTRSLANPASFEVEQSVISKAQAAKKIRAPDPFVPIGPTRELRESHVGILREIRPRVDQLKAFRVPDTLMGRASLGSIGKQEMGKITVHVPYPTEDDYTESFTAWMPAKLLRDRRIRQGITVSVDLEGVRIVGRGFAWFCRSLEALR